MLRGGYPRKDSVGILPSGSTSGVKRVFNFNAGPSALPLPVLERIREELLDWHGSGMSVMEMSHRSPEFMGINAAAEAGLRKHLAIPDDYAVIFVQGGGSMQFSMVPMNLYLPGEPVGHDPYGSLDGESARRTPKRHSPSHHAARQKQ